jgi:hypothetical protein
MEFLKAPLFGHLIMPIMVMMDWIQDSAYASITGTENESYVGSRNKQEECRRKLGGFMQRILTVRVQKVRFSAPRRLKEGRN